MQPYPTVDFGSPEITNRMAQVLVWRDEIPDNLLKLTDLGKPSFLGARPDGIIADTNLENASGAWH
jgi:hypothetical protein